MPAPRGKKTTHLMGEQSADTKFFFEITPDRILAAVERFGFRCTGRVTQLNSMENRVYDVEIEPQGQVTSARDRFKIIKFYRPGRWSKEQILEEHEFLLDLQNQEIPVVAPLVHESGATLLKVDEFEIYFSVFPKAGGRSPDELSDDQADQIGRLLARVHNIGAAKEAPHRLKLTPTVYGRDNLAYLKGAKLLPAELADSFEAVVEQICTMCEPWFADTARHRIHGDCHFGNILWGTEGLTMVDFDDMVVGPAVQDFWLLLPGRDSYAKKKLDLLLAGYEQLRPFDRAETLLIEPLRALRLIHYAAWVGRRWHDPAFPKAFPHFGTPEYWRGQLADLQEQLQVMRTGGFGETEADRDW